MIQGKHKPILQKGAGIQYNPDTFHEYKQPNFYTVETADELLVKVNTFQMYGRHFITFDTETHPYFAHSHEVPSNVVRRWVGKGSKATPQDYPFELSICDGTNCFALYDSVENGFKEFKKLQVLFKDPLIEKVAHNTKYDMHMFQNAGLQIVGRLHDTVVVCKLADENRSSFELKKLSEHDGIVIYEYMVDAYKQLHKITDYRQIPKELLSEYANADVWNAYIRFTKEYPILIRDELEELYNNEMEMMIPLYMMERKGMKVDAAYETEVKQELRSLTDLAEKAIYEEAGTLFNINSTQQLANVLLDLGVASTRLPKTDKGNYSLDKDALARMDDIPIVENILEFRKYEKLLGTYANGIYEQRDADFFVHSSINQTEATTGRMSITKPALQTLPKKDKRIRRCFIPSKPENTLYFMDLDQIEYRLYAHYCKSQDLLRMIDNGYDIHRATAAIIYNKNIEEVSDEERANGKTINFALIYGVGIKHLAELLKVTQTQAEHMKSTYFMKLPEAKPFIDTVQQVIKVRGFVKNFYGRRRRLSTNDCYKAPNALIQGCAADYIKHKLVLIYKYLMYNKYSTFMNNIVHDEVIIDNAPNEEHILPTLRWLLSDFTSFRCKITAGIEKGAPSWGQKEELVDDIGFKEPESFEFINYDVFNGEVFKCQ